MNPSFYIVDDDKSIRKVLKNIIDQYNLGDVIGEAEDGIRAMEDIKNLRPQIVLIDLLLPGMDGIAIVCALKDMDLHTNYIMISQVTSKEMVSKAYTKGVEFYINKPINVVEVVSIINKVKEKLKMKEVIHSFEKAIHSMHVLKEYTGGREMNVTTEKDRIKKILSQLGILGEAGSNDIVEMILILLEQKEEVRGRLLNQKISELFAMLNQRYREDYEITTNVAAIEQRIRRAINKALKNIANLGIEDYGNDTFIKYGNTIFDFKEVRNQMDHIRGKSNYGGKISVRKFIEGIMMEMKNES
ncbi:two-component system response regulator YcbB [Anaerosolibacter carboniphilus]|uniref:Stage 0 sporulation protein A homolog n=1 Tax=Anaerosolibacter carboniphilus TaxID=1417629 RepID=A0A841KW68_9FIRM|nr:response regulator [Anaerosolibacter carboniphilus]MBB6216260.1 two-component system response regulator YcbB [Anaerosolibacter carboniphilus]